MTELRRGEVFVTNWHNLERCETRDVNGQSARVVKRGQPVEKIRTVKVTATLTADQIRHQATVGAFEIKDVEYKRDGTPKAFTVKETQYLESDAAFLKRILGGRKGRSSGILVLNDEAHHAYRRGTIEDADLRRRRRDHRGQRARGHGVDRRSGPNQQIVGRAWQRNPHVRGPLGHAVLHPG
jgi:type III restriction enzyme